MLADQLCTTIDTQGTEMLAIFQELVVVDNNFLIEKNQPPKAPSAPTVNVTAHTDVKLEMLHILHKCSRITLVKVEGAEKVEEMEENAATVKGIQR